MAQKKRETKDKLTKSSSKTKNPKLDSKKQKPPKAKKAGVKDLHPKVSNKDSVTDNIKSISAQSVEDQGLGKIQRVPLHQKLSVDPSQKGKKKK